MAYCDFFKGEDYSQCKSVCETFVKELYYAYPEFQKKVKIHLMLHLTDCMLGFGPTCGFNTER